MTAESNTKFMETAISQKIPFLGLIILIFTVITSTRLWVALMCYILFFGIRYTLYMSSASRLPPQKVVATCHVMFGWRNGWAGGFVNTIRSSSRGKNWSDKQVTSSDTLKGAETNHRASNWTTLSQKTISLLWKGFSMKRFATHSY